MVVLAGSLTILSPLPRALGRCYPVDQNVVLFVLLVFVVVVVLAVIEVFVVLLLPCLFVVVDFPP